MRNFLSDYTAGKADLLEFFEAPAGQLFETAPKTEAWAPELADCVRDFQSTLGHSAAIAGDEAVIVTGQQPAIFTGPLYTIYKAVTALGLARRVRAKFEVPCVPMFWVGGDDHDFDEACTTYVLTKAHEPLKVRYEPACDITAIPMYKVPLEASLKDTIVQIAEQTPGSEFTGEVSGMLEETFEASASLSEWTTRLLARLFQDTELVFFAPHLPESRRLSAEVIRREIETPLESTRLLNAAGSELSKLGFKPQVIKADNECNFFLEVEGRRRKVLFDKGVFKAPEEGVEFAPEELLALLDSEPERFSPNVVLRCVAQQHLFPVAAYVAGPGELAYWAQLKPVFGHFGLRMPIVYPRAQAVLTTMKLNKIRTKLGIDLDDLAKHDGAALETAIANTTQNPAYALCIEKRAALEESLAAFHAELTGKDKNAGAMAEAMMEEMARRLDRIEQAILRTDADKNEAVRNQVERLCNSLMPMRKPQERVYSVFSYLFEHGPSLIERLIAELDPCSSQTQEIEL